MDARRFFREVLRTALPTSPTYDDLRKLREDIQRENDKMVDSIAAAIAEARRQAGNDVPPSSEVWKEGFRRDT